MANSRNAWLLAMVMLAMAASAQAQSFVLKWSPQANGNGAHDGMNAFESIEDDRSNSDPGGKPHIFVQGSNYRFKMPLKQHESVHGSTASDRQRNEVAGMIFRQSGDIVRILKGETWRLRHKLFIPQSLKATTSFTHIMQLKQPGIGTAPILVMSLRIRNNVPTIEVNLDTSSRTKVLGSAALSPLQDKWLESQITFTASDNGAIQWLLRDVATNAVIVQADGRGDLFLADRVRPKWGIYRSLDDAAHLQDCFMLTTDMQAWKLQ